MKEVGEFGLVGGDEEGVRNPSELTVAGALPFDEVLRRGKRSARERRKRIRGE